KRNVRGDKKTATRSDWAWRKRLKRCLASEWLKSGIGRSRCAARYRPEVAPAQRGAIRCAPRSAPQGPGDLADLDLGPAARGGACLCHRPAQARARSWGRGRHHRRQPPTPLRRLRGGAEHRRHRSSHLSGLGGRRDGLCPRPRGGERSEEHTSELQSRENLVCRLLLEKKKK